MLLACLLLACQKEDGITPGTGFENLYTIQDDPNDSIQHKRYEPVSYTHLLSLWYDKEFLFVGKQSRALHFSGHIKRYERIETILSAITDVTGVEFRMNGQIILIR